MPAPAAQKLHQSDSSALRRRLLIIELGSAGVGHVGSDDYDETVAIPQLQGEAPAVFMQRVMARIALVEKSGGAFDSAVLMTGTRHDAATHAARRLLVSGLTGHTRSVAELTDVLVDADASASPRVRQDLLELVSELVAGSDARQSVPIRLRFKERASGRDERSSRDEPSSGVFWSVPPPSQA